MGFLRNGSFVFVSFLIICGPLAAEGASPYPQKPEDIGSCQDLLEYLRHHYPKAKRGSEQPLEVPDDLTSPMERRMAPRRDLEKIYRDYCLKSAMTPEQVDKRMHSSTQNVRPPRLE